METQLQSQLRQHIECKVCFEIYTNPYVLCCLHTFCYGCIKETGIRQNGIKCPICRQISYVKNVKKDFRTQELIDIYIQKIETCKNTSGIQCDGCESDCESIDNYCPSCEEMLCTICSKNHRKRKATKEHQLTAFTDLLASQKEQLVETITCLKSESIDAQSKIVLLVDEKDKLLKKKHEKID